MGRKRTRKAARQINIGNGFQAEIPTLQDRSHLEEEEERASLVWKPWGDMATNPETQDRVTNLLTMARSRGMLGGGSNLELALHCLHEAQGNVLEALDMLLSGVPQQPESHPLANYHYAGSDTWTLLEKKLFKEAFSLYNKNFHLIQKKIQTKTVSQCVEYYYTWKKTIEFTHSRAQGMNKQLQSDKDEVVEAENKAGCSSRKRRHHAPKGTTKKARRGGGKMPRSTGSPSCHTSEPLCWDAGAGDADAIPCRTQKDI